MDLKTWMFQNDLSCADIAKKMKCSASTVSLLRKGKVPSVILCARRLELFTKGEVTLKDLAGAARNQKSNAKNKDHEEGTENED